METFVCVQEMWRLFEKPMDGIGWFIFIFVDQESASCVWIFNGGPPFISTRLKFAHASSREQQRQEKPTGKPCENVYLIFLCPLVQSPCSIPLLTVSTVSTSNPVPIHPQSNRNLLIHW